MTLEDNASPTAPLPKGYKKERGFDYESFQSVQF